MRTGAFKMKYALHLYCKSLSTTITKVNVSQTSVYELLIALPMSDEYCKVSKRRVHFLVALSFLPNVLNIWCVYDKCKKCGKNGGLADQCWIHKQEVVGSSPVMVNFLCP